MEKLYNVEKYHYNGDFWSNYGSYTADDVRLIVKGCPKNDELTKGCGFYRNGDAVEGIYCRKNGRDFFTVDRADK